MNNQLIDQMGRIMDLSEKIGELKYRERYMRIVREERVAESLEAYQLDRDKHYVNLGILVDRLLKEKEALTAPAFSSQDYYLLLIAIGFWGGGENGRPHTDWENKKMIALGKKIMKLTKLRALAGGAK